MENLLIIVGFVLLSAFSSWLKKRNEERAAREQSPMESEDSPLHGQPQAPPQPPPSSSPKPGRPWDWQEELRRMLEGETAPMEASPPPPPPPLPAKPQRVPPLVPIPSENNRGPLPKPGVLPRPSTHPRPVVSPAVVVTAAPHPLAALASQGYESARQLTQKQSAHRRKLPDVASTVPVVVARKRSVETAAALQIFRNPGTARQAIVASIIFNPPKGLQDPRQAHINTPF